MSKSQTRTAALSLLVIRSSDLLAASAFYACIGIRFYRHRHGGGPEHLCSTSQGSVFEIYALTPGQPATTSTRLGFRVADVEHAVERLRETGARICVEASASPWGLRSVVADPDGHRVELTEFVPHMRRPDQGSSPPRA